MSTKYIVQERPKAVDPDYASDWYDDPDIQECGGEEEALRRVAEHGTGTHHPYLYEHRVIRRTEEVVGVIQVA